MSRRWQVAATLVLLSVDGTAPDSAPTTGLAGYVRESGPGVGGNASMLHAGGLLKLSPRHPGTSSA